MLIHKMKNKRGSKKRDFSSILDHYGAIVILCTYIFISVIILVILFAHPKTASQTSIDKVTIYNKGFNETADIMNEAPNIEIFGSQVFRDNIEDAIRLLSKCDPKSLATANSELTGIFEDNGSFAGADISVGSTIAEFSDNFIKYLPNNLSQAHTFWYAGAIINEARHVWQFRQPGLFKNPSSRTQGENNALELDALVKNIQTMKRCVNYVPASQKGEAKSILEAFENLEDSMHKLQLNESG